MNKVYQQQDVVVNLWEHVAYIVYTVHLTMVCGADPENFQSRLYR
jgi:hypothetical protein